jgi:hypothetical protein
MAERFVCVGSLAPRASANKEAVEISRYDGEYFLIKLGTGALYFTKQELAALECALIRVISG